MKGNDPSQAGGSCRELHHRSFKNVCYRTVPYSYVNQGRQLGTALGTVRETTSARTNTGRIPYRSKARHADACSEHAEDSAARGSPEAFPSSFALIFVAISVFLALETVSLTVVIARGRLEPGRLRLRVAYLRPTGVRGREVSSPSKGSRLSGTLGSRFLRIFLEFDRLQEHGD